MAKWQKTVNIKDLLGDDGSPEEVVRVAALLVGRLRDAFPAPDDDLSFIIQDFEDITINDDEPLELFNETLNDLYDWADYNRVWLGL